MNMIEHIAYEPVPEDQAKLSQFPTPVWAAELLVSRYFGDLNANDRVCEPFCGPGSFLMALPDEVQAVGYEIDPRTAAIARINTSRRIVEGDFLAAKIDFQPTAFISNPPFNLRVIDAMLDRAHDVLPDGGRVGLILPAYAFQTAERVVGYAKQWSLAQDMIPRNIYPGLSLPLMFATFRKAQVRTMVGLALYHETTDVLSLKKQYREVINSVGKSVWKATIAKALAALGGRAHLEAIFAEVEGRKPTATRWWREQIRKVLRQCDSLFKAEGDGWYSFAAMPMSTTAGG
jgi:predicted RNA methylase